MIEPELIDESELEKGQIGVCIHHEDGTYNLKVRKDLWKNLWLNKQHQNYIIAHEQYHSIDPDNEFWLEDEREADFYAFKRYPIGWIFNIIYFIITPNRWYYYLKRIKDKK